MPILKDLTGLRYGRLTVVSRAPNNSAVSWHCKCDCGKTTISNGQSLRRGESNSCGCYKRELAADAMRATFTTHGCSRTTHNNIEYRCWLQMRRRCNQPTD